MVRLGTVRVYFKTPEALDDAATQAAQAYMDRREAHLGPDESTEFAGLVRYDIGK